MLSPREEYALRKARQARQDQTAFKSLIANPPFYGTSVVLPSGCDLWIKSTTTESGEFEIFRVRGKPYKISNPVAGQFAHVGWFEKNSIIDFVSLALPEFVAYATFPLLKSPVKIFTGQGLKSILFSSGQQGFFFDPLDPSTAYQDSAGTTAGVVGQPMGLRFDKRLGGVPGPRLDANGDLIGSTSGWSLQATPTVTWNADSNVTITATVAAAQGITQNIATVVGQSYEVIYSGDGGANTLRVSIGGTVITNGTGARSGRYVYVATGVSTSLTFQVIATVIGQAVTANFFRVRAVAGNHATQGTSASRPVWTQDGSGYFRDTFDAFDDFLTTSAGVAQQMFYCAALHVAGGAGTSRRIFANFEPATFKGYGLSIHTTNQLRLVAGNGVAFVGCLSVQTLDVDGKYVVTAWHDGANLNVQINQGSVVQAAFGAVTATGLTTLTEGRDNETAANLFNGSLYARVYRAGPPPSAAQIAQVQRFIASRAGVVL